MRNYWSVLFDSIFKMPYREGVLVRLYYFWQETFTSAAKSCIAAAWFALLLYMVPGAFLARYFLFFLISLLFVAVLLRPKTKFLTLKNAVIAPVTAGEEAVLSVDVFSEKAYAALSLEVFRLDDSLKRANPLDSFFSIGASDYQQFSIKIKTEKRGLFLLKKTAVLLKDPIGLVNSAVIYQNVLELVVYPKAVRIGSFSFLLNGVSGRDFSLLLRPFMERGMDFKGVRPYREGDSLRDVDYRAFARHLKPFTKEFGVEMGGGLVLVLDLRFDRWRDKVYFESAISLTAGIAFWLLERQVLDRFFINDQEIDLKGREKRFLILQALAKIETPRLKSKEAPKKWEPAAIPMGPVFAVCLKKNHSKWIKKQIVLHSETIEHDSVMYWNPSPDDEVFL